MPGLWRNAEGTRQGKYLVVRRDGSIPEAPVFVLVAADPAAATALHAYAMCAEGLEMDAEYVSDVKELGFEFSQWRSRHGQGDPDAPRHREDDPGIVGWMETGIPPAHLGCATTRQLLQELETRAHIEQFRDRKPQLEAFESEMGNWLRGGPGDEPLPDAFLDYRTVDGH